MCTSAAMAESVQQQQQCQQPQQQQKQQHDDEQQPEKRNDSFFWLFLAFLIMSFTFALMFSFSLIGPNFLMPEKEKATKTEIDQLRATIDKLEKEIAQQKCTNNTPEFANDELYPLDQIPLSLGVEIAGGLMEVIIGRQTKLPVKASHITVLPKSFANGESVVRIFEGERRLTEDNKLLGEYKISGRSGEDEVVLTVEVNSDRLIHVKAEAANKGTKNGIALLHYQKRLYTRGEVDRLVCEAHGARAKDAQRLVDILERQKWWDKWGCSINIGCGLFLIVSVIGCLKK